jgi:fumarylacetoacetate (FAA) hydrolase
MKLATRSNGHPDGVLLVVSHDLERCVPARAARTLQEALDRWSDVESSLNEQYVALNEGREREAAPVEPGTLIAAMPRSYQFLDGSAFLAHNHILAEAWGFPRRSPVDPPLMYQGLSDQFLPAHGAVTFRSEADEIDFEAEFAVITDRVPLGTSREQAIEHIKLVVLLNDWSLAPSGPRK